MINRYIVDAEAEELKRIYGLGEVPGYNITYNAVPTEQLPVILNTETDRLSHVFWGQTPQWSNRKKLSDRFINTSLEEVKTRKSSLTAWEQRRCAVPATGFVFWKQLGKKTAIPYLYHLPDFEPFTMGGLWDLFSDLEDNQYKTFKLLTVNSSNLGIYTPFILTEKDLKRWLDKDDDLVDFKAETTPNLQAYSISPMIGNADHSSKKLIQHVPPVDQRGNYTLFS